VVSRREQVAATRRKLMETAERLLAEHGLEGVSDRRILEVAGQGNKSALIYHFGTREDLILAIARTHGEAIATRTRQLVESARGSTDPADHVACLVQPYVDHLSTLGNPSWCARFGARLAADLDFVDRLGDSPHLSPLLQEALGPLWSSLPDLPTEVAQLRMRTVRLSVIHTCAEEEARAARTGTPATWQLIGRVLVECVTAALLAPHRPLRPR
jgi:AcrR family transcriptional regulator